MVKICRGLASYIFFRLAYAAKIKKFSFEIHFCDFIAFSVKVMQICNASAILGLRIACEKGSKAIHPAN